MFVVKYKFLQHEGPFLERTFPETMVPKVLQSGALRIVEPAEFEVPDMDEEAKEHGTEVKLIKPEKLVAVFHGEYILERE